MSQPAEIPSLETLAGMFRPLHQDKSWWQGFSAELSTIRGVITEVVDEVELLLALLYATYREDYDPSARSIQVLPCAKSWNWSDQEAEEDETDFKYFLITGDVLTFSPLHGMVTCQPSTHAVVIPLTSSVTDAIWMIGNQYIDDAFVSLIVMAHDVDLSSGQAKLTKIMLKASYSDEERNLKSRLIQVVDRNDRAARKYGGKNMSQYDIVPSVITTNDDQIIKRVSAQLELPEVQSWYQQTRYPLTDKEVDHFWNLLGLSTSEKLFLREQIFERDSGQVPEDDGISLCSAWGLDYAAAFRRGESMPEWEILSHDEDESWKYLGSERHVDGEAFAGILNNALVLWRHLEGNEQFWQLLSREAEQFTSKLHKMTIPDE